MHSIVKPMFGCGRNSHSFHFLWYATFAKRYLPRRFWQRQYFSPSIPVHSKNSMYLYFVFIIFLKNQFRAGRISSHPLKKRKASWRGIEPISLSHSRYSRASKQPPPLAGKARYPRLPFRLTGTINFLIAGAGIEPA